MNDQESMENGKLGQIHTALCLAHSLLHDQGISDPHYNKLLPLLTEVYGEVSKIMGQIRKKADEREAEATEEDCKREMGDER